PERINCGPMKLGRCYVADVIGMDPIAEIKSYRGPVLIVHGTKDNIVKLDYSRQAQRAYPNAKLHIIEGGAHGFGKKHDAIAIAHLRRFLS
ncbi:MAG: alpha/beta hydrolase, partial [Ruminococcaceae bacterium]|nr:alpha/beta hydrolase [Oscillospiraceae bacterium]